MVEENTFLDAHPELHAILKTHGSKTVMEYIDFVNTQVQSLDFSYFSERFEEFSEVYTQTVTPILGASVAQRSLETLKKNRLVSTADHQGVINHPFSLSSTYARTLHALESHESVVTFSCASVSLSNSSFPRGLLLQDTHNETKKIYFKSLAHKLHPVYVEEPVTRFDASRAIDTLSSVALSDKEKRVLLTSCKSIFLSDTFLALSDFDTQSTYGSWALWKEIPLCQKTDLIFLSSERIVSSLLIHCHLGKDTLLWSLLSDEKTRSLFVEYFDGIQGAFSTKEKKGTHLFWGVENSVRVSLFVEGNTLVTGDGRVFLELTQDQIHTALVSKRIIPAMPLVFIALSFYYGFVCGGGFSQVDYLGDMKRAWIRVLHTLKPEEISHVEGLPTNVYLGDFAFLKNENGTLMSSLDLLMCEQTPSDDVSLFDAYKNLENTFSQIHF